MSRPDTHRVTVTVTVAADGVVTATCTACPQAHLTAVESGTWEPPEVTAFRSSHEHRSDS